MVHVPLPWRCAIDAISTQSVVLVLLVVALDVAALPSLPIVAFRLIPPPTPSQRATSTQKTSVQLPDATVHYSNRDKPGKGAGACRHSGANSIGSATGARNWYAINYDWREQQNDQPYTSSTYGLRWPAERKQRTSPTWTLHLSSFNFNHSGPRHRAPFSLQLSLN